MNSKNAVHAQLFFEFKQFSKNDMRLSGQALGKGGFVDCCLRSEQQLGGLGKSVLAFQSIDQFAREHLSGKFAYLESPLGERFQKFVVRIRVGIRLRVVRVENLGRAIEAQAITRLGEERHKSGEWRVESGR